MAAADSHRRRRLVAVAAGALFLLSLGTAAALQLGDVRDHLNRARADLGQARDALVKRQDAPARAAVARAKHRLADAERITDGFFVKGLGVVPLLGSPARAAADATDAAQEATAAARIVVDTGSRLHAAGGEAMRTKDFSGFHGTAVDSAAALRQAREHLDDAAARMRGPRGAALPLVSSQARSVAEEIDQARRAVGTAERALGLLTGLTGTGTDVRLLVVAQDTFELRPTGGYLGSYGVVRFSQGRVHLEKYEASETLPSPDPPMEPPAALAPALPRGWFMSNGNWWPDFPTSARTVAELFRRQGGGHVDGVLAVTEDAAGRLVGVVEPVKVPGYAEPVVEKGFARRALHEVLIKQPSDVPRKKFLISLASVLFDQLLALPEDRLPTLVDALDRSAAAGELQLWFADEARQKAVVGTAAAGSLPRPSGDFLMLVDANMSATESNLDLVKRATYRVSRGEGGRWRAHLEVVVRNEGRYDARLNPYYNGYLRVYVPAGARLVRERPDQGDAGPAPDGPYRVFAQLLDVPPLQEQRVEFDYELPADVADDERYRLTWLRQVGTPRDILTAEVGGKQAKVEGRQLSLEHSLRGHPVAEWLEDRWLVRRLTGD